MYCIKAKILTGVFFLLFSCVGCTTKTAESNRFDVGPRPQFLVEDMDEGPLKQQLQSCKNSPIKKTDFSIGHRGAPLQFPEHTKESYQAAALMGAGILECDVTFTKDLQLVCRHSQCDLHTTTNILMTPLAAKCSKAFTPFDPVTGADASANCCTSDITLAEFKSLRGKMDGFNPKATNVDEYVRGTANWRTDLYASKGTLMTHAESIALFKQLGVKMTPELKSPSVAMPFQNHYNQAAYAQQMIDEYKAAGIHPRDVWPQSFDIQDIRYWLAQEPEFARQAVYLDDAETPEDLPTAADLKSFFAEGIKIVAPPIWALLTINHQQKIVASDYAKNAKQAGLEIIAWSLERSGPVQNGGGWYYQSINPALNNEGDLLTLLDVLAKDAGVIGVFSDWPATTSYYASCMQLQ